MTRVQDIDKHQALLADITVAYPNSITAVGHADRFRRELCLEHVLGLVSYREYDAIRRRVRPDIFAGAKFAHWLIDRGHLIEVPKDDARDGDLVMYFREGDFKHVGHRRADGRITSKWGIGHIYDHILFEVPASYGDELRYYEPLAPDTAFELFKMYADENWPDE